MEWRYFWQCPSVLHVVPHSILCSEYNPCIAHVLRPLLADQCGPTHLGTDSRRWHVKNCRVFYHAYRFSALTETWWSNYKTQTLYILSPSFLSVYQISPRLDCIMIECWSENLMLELLTQVLFLKQCPMNFSLGIWARISKISLNIPLPFYGPKLHEVVFLALTTIKWKHQLTLNHIEDSLHPAVQNIQPRPCSFSRNAEAHPSHY